MSNFRNHNFGNNRIGGGGLGSKQGQGIYEESSTPNYAIGEKLELADGRVFRYGYTAAAINRGLLVSQDVSATAIVESDGKLTAASAGATEVTYTGRDVRYTAKGTGEGETLYAHCLGWPGAEVILKAPSRFLYPGEITSVTMLGSDEPLRFRQTPLELTFSTPKERVGDHAFVFRIERRNPYM